MARFGHGILRQDRSSWGICVSGGHTPYEMKVADLSDYCVAKAIYDNIPYAKITVDDMKNEMQSRVDAGTWSAPDVTPVVRTDEQIMAEMALRQFFLAAGL